MDQQGVHGAAEAEAADRRAARRAARISAGVEELEQRLADLLRAGLATADRTGYGLWEETAARMVDAQAPGLATRVRELGAIPGSGSGWPARLLEECALTHLLGRAWTRIDALPEPLASAVRTRVGLTAPADGPTRRDHWSVLAQYDTSDGKLTTRRIWLHGRRTGRTALVLSYGAAGRAPALALPVGTVVDAELIARPGAGGLRMELGERFADPARDKGPAPGEGPSPGVDPTPGAGPPPGGGVTEALAAYGSALREDPWLDTRPVTLAAVIPLPDGRGGWQLAEADGSAALPLSPAALGRPGLWRLAAVSGGRPVTVFGECGHRGLTPLAVWSAYGDRARATPEGAVTAPPLVALV